VTERRLWLGLTAGTPVLGSALLAECGAGLTVAATRRSSPRLELAPSSAWQETDAPSDTKLDDEICGMSRADSSHCSALGDHREGASNQLSLIEAYRGTRWAAQSSPNISDPASGYYVDELFDISRPSATDCRAVGDYVGSHPEETRVIEHHDGLAWSIVTASGQADPTNGATTSVHN